MTPPTDQHHRQQGAGKPSDNGKPLTEAEIAKVRTVLNMANGDEAAAREHLTKHGMSHDRAAEALALIADTDAEGFKVELIQASTVKSKRTEWLWADKIPLAMLTLIVGTEGHGKSAAMLRLMAMLTTGELPGKFFGKPQKVAILQVEDDRERTINPRLEGAGADLDMVFYLKLKKNAKDAGFILPRDGEKIGRALGENDVKCVGVDPFAQILDPRLSSYKDTDVRQALTPLVEAAGEHDFTVAGTLHTNKTKTGDARERAMGSVGWGQVARSILHLGIDPDNPEGKDGNSRVIAHRDCNVGRKSRSQRFELVEEIVQIEGQPARIVRAEFGEECDHDANALVAAESGIDREKIGGETGRAAAMLHELLANGPIAAKKVEEEAEARDLKWRTVEEAKKKLGIQSKNPKGANAWVWQYSGMEI